MHTRIRAAREQAGFTREKFAEKLDVSVSYLAELERGKTGISVKMLKKICSILGLSSDFILFGENRDGDDLILEKIHRIDAKYLSLLNNTISELLQLSQNESQEIISRDI